LIDLDAVKRIGTPNKPTQREPSMSNEQRDRSGAERLVWTFVDAGVRVCFTNPGTSLIEAVI